MIGEIENAILARLKAAQAGVPLGYRWATLETYPANWDEYLRDKVPDAPGAWVVFGGGAQAEAVSIGSARLPATFGVVVMAENARNETAQRHGGQKPDGTPLPAEPGSYQLAEDVIQLIHGQTLGLDIDALKLSGVHFVRSIGLIKDRNVSMLAVTFETAIAFLGTAPVFPAPGGSGNPIGDFRTFHANWELPGYGVVDADPDEPSTQLPDDAHAGKSDHVTLETETDE